MPALAGAFPTVTPSSLVLGFPSVPLVMADHFGNLNGWSLGAMVTLPLPAQPTIVKPWTINGWSIAIQGALWIRSVGPVTGVLPKLYAGLILGSPVVPSVAQIESGPNLYVQPFQQPSSDQLPYLTELWDGSQDPPFPWLTAGNNSQAPPSGGFLQASSTLPQPAPLRAGDQIGLGLWLTPNLISADSGQGPGAVVITSAQYNVSYQ